MLRRRLKRTDLSDAAGDVSDEALSDGSANEEDSEPVEPVTPMSSFQNGRSNDGEEHAVPSTPSDSAAADKQQLEVP